MKNSPHARIAFVAVALSSATCAFAQSSLKISGVIDIGVYRDTHAATTNVGPISRSYVVFSGNEDLGGGLSAIYSLGTRLEPDTGAVEGVNKPFWHHESTVGLKGGFGRIQLGRRLDVTNSLDWQFDPFYNFNRLASPAWDTWHYNFPSDPRANNGTADYGRLNNGIYYDSPRVGGFAAHFSGSPETVSGDVRKPLAGGVSYNSTEFAAMVAHSRNSAGNLDNFLGAKYMGDGWALMGAYNVSKAGSSTAKAATVGAEYTLGSVTLKGGIGQVKVDDVKAARTLGTGAYYALSKRTTVYGNLARKKFESYSTTLFGVGVSHAF